MLRMKVRERMGTSVRTTVKVKVTTDGDRHQDMVTVTTETWEREEDVEASEHEGL